MRKYTKLEGAKKDLGDREKLFKDLKKLMDPKYIEVKGIFTPRGGISIYPFANYADKEHEELKKQRLFAQFNKVYER